MSIWDKEGLAGDGAELANELYAAIKEWARDAIRLRGCDEGGALYIAERVARVACRDAAAEPETRVGRTYEARLDDCWVYPQRPHDFGKPGLEIKHQNRNFLLVRQDSWIDYENGRQLIPIMYYVFERDPEKKTVRLLREEVGTPHGYKLLINRLMDQVNDLARKARKK